MKMSYTEAWKKINALRNAKGKNGAVLYDDTDIANAFGYRSIGELENAMHEARTEYRGALVDKANALHKEGMSTLEISRNMGLDIDTVECLMDEEFNIRITKKKELEKERSKLLERTIANMDSIQKEFDTTFRKFGL